MPETVLVTGASGYIAAHVINEFLQAGFHVRGTVRSQKSGDNVVSLYPGYENALSFATVPDIAAPGAFDEAVKGVDGVVHTASPFILNAKDYDKDLFQPALNGTTSVLKAVKAFNPNVKRIVITSSFASVLDTSKGNRPGYTYTEADWNPLTPEETKDPVNAYLVSKTIAERAAFDFVEKEKPNFTIATVAPPMVYGPMLNSVDNMASLNTSSADIYRLFNGSQKTVPDTGFWAYADVRDLAKAHLLAYTTPAAANQRYLITNSRYSMEEFCDIIGENFPDLRDTTPAPSKPVPEVYKLDTTKARKELGITFRPMKETLVDAVTRLREIEKSLK